MQVDFRRGTVEDLPAIAELSRQMWFVQPTLAVDGQSASGSADSPAGGASSQGQTDQTTDDRLGEDPQAVLSAEVAWNDTLTLFSQATYSELALDQGRVVGALLARVDQDAVESGPQADWLRQELADSRQRLETTAAGRHYLADMQADQAGTQQMEEAVRPDTQAELLLFILGSQTRGLGVGSRLYEHFLNHLHERGVDSYYLYTDSKCSYGFYDHRGLRRVVERVDQPVPGGGRFDKFIYQGWLDSAAAQPFAQPRVAGEAE